MCVYTYMYMYCNAYDMYMYMYDNYTYSLTVLLDVRYVYTKNTQWGWINPTETLW